MADYTGSLEIFGRNFQRGEMKATLEFDTPEEWEHLLAALHGMDWKSVVWEIDQFLRDKLKYGHDFKSADEALEKTREELRDILQSFGLFLE